MGTASAAFDIGNALVLRKRIRHAGFFSGALLGILTLVFTGRFELQTSFAQTLLIAGSLGTVFGGASGAVLAEIGRWFIPGQWRLERELTARRPRARGVARITVALKYALVFGIPLLIAMVVIPIHKDRDLQARIAYAWQETGALRQAVEDFHTEHRALPADARALGAVGHRTDYPDGGYYLLESNGRVRIRFTVKPELVNGAVVLTPKIKNDKLQWVCTSEGEFEQRYLPRSCRE